MKHIWETVMNVLVMSMIMLVMAYTAGIFDDYIYDYEFKPKMVMVYPGDTVWGIAAHELDNQNRWDLRRMIYEIKQQNGIANSQVSTLQPGMMLTIPLYIKK